MTGWQKLKVWTSLILFFGVCGLVEYAVNHGH